MVKNKRPLRTKRPKPTLNVAKFRKQTTLQKRGWFRKGLVVKRVISERGRKTFAAAPGATQPQTAQNILLESTVITQFNYKKGVLTIYFQSGHAYEYYDVPAPIVGFLSTAQSKGRYFYYNIRTNYKFKRIR